MITLSWPLYYAMLYAHWVLFLVAPIALFRLGWFATGGLVMLIATLMPIAGQTWFTDSDAPGLGLLLMVELPIAALVLLAGIGMSVARLVRRWRATSDQV